MFSCYRKDETHNPEIYCAAVAAVLGDGCSREVVEYVTDPRTGIPGRIKFLPSVAEVKEACQARAADLERMDRYSRLKPVSKVESKPKLGTITYTEFLENCRRDNRPARPIGRFEQ